MGRLNNKLHGVYRLSQSNGSTTPLGGDASYTGTGEEVDEFASVTVYAYSDVGSAPGGLQIQFSNDGTNWDFTHRETVHAGVGGVFTQGVGAKYMRIVYTNGPDAQSTFRLQVRLHNNQSLPPNNVTGGGQKISRDSFTWSGFEELFTVSRTNVIELRSNLSDVSNLRNFTTTAGSGSVTLSGSEYVIATTASASDSARLESAERGRYVPGYSAEIGIGVRYTGTPTGDMEAKWGGFDDNNGVYFGEDATGIFVATLSGGTESKIYQSAWNTDRLDGTGPSQLTLDLSEGNIFQIRYSWYGYGTVVYEVVMPDKNGDQRTIICHQFSPTQSVSIEEPNLPITAEVSNGSTATAQTIYVGGRQFSIIGDYTPVRRITSEYRLSTGSIGTTFVPLIAFRRKSSREAVSVKVDGFDIIGDADLIVQIRTSPTSLTGASYGTPTDHSATETALEVDKSATAISGGEVIWEGLVSSTGSGSNRAGFAARDVIQQDFINTEAMVLCVRRISGTGATASAVFRVTEEW